MALPTDRTRVRVTCRSSGVLAKVLVVRSPWSIALDAALIVVFAVVGRASHAEGLTVGGIAATGWPFLVTGVLGSGLGYAVFRFSWWLEGLVVWGFAALGGMVLRVGTGGTAAPAFIAVASASLAVLLLGWRAIAHTATRHRRTSSRRAQPRA